MGRVEAQQLPHLQAARVSAVGECTLKGNRSFDNSRMKLNLSTARHVIGFTHRPRSSSFLGLPYRILNLNHKKELLRGLWVELKRSNSHIFKLHVCLLSGTARSKETEASITPE